MRHAKPVEGHAKYIGRVGALAVALGIGAAVATTPGVAWAGTGDSTSEGGDDGSGTGDGTAGVAGADADTGAGSRPHVGGGSLIGIGTRIVTGALIGRQPTGRTVAEDDSPPAHQNVITTPTARRGTFGSRLTALIDAPSDAGSVAPSLTDTVVHPSGVLSPHASPIFGGGGGRPVFGLGARPTAPASAPAAGPADVAPLSITTLDAPALVTHPLTATPVVLPPPTRAAALAALPGSFISVATGLISGVLNPGQFGGGPTAPVDPPMLWAVLAFVRRQFVNSTPTLNPTPTGTDPTTGLVYGNLGATDADGDPVTYDLVTRPSHGDIDINQSTGDYVYTPTAADYSGTDTFVVAVSDGGSDGVFGFLRPASGHTSATAITITVDPVTTTPPVNHPPTGSASATAPDPVTGTLTVTVVASDPDGQAVTITPPAMTGTLTPTGSTTVAGVTTATYSFTPGQSARDAAAATMGVDTTMLTFTVTDTAGAATPAGATVTIAPTPLVNPTNPVTINPVTDTATGAVTGQINGSAAATGYTVTNPPTHGELALNPDGSFIYTPNPPDRITAYETPGPDTDSFTITVTDEHGGSTPVTVSAVPVVPVRAAITSTAAAALPPGTSYGVVGGDGTLAAATSTGTYGSVTDPDRTTVTVIRPNGTITTTPPIAGSLASLPVVGADGTVYQSTFTGTHGSVSDPFRTTVTVIDPDGNITTTAPITGIPNRDLVVGTDGTAAQTTFTGTYGSVSDPFRTTVTVLHPDGTTTSTGPVTGYPDGPPGVGTDGTVYQTTYTGVFGSVSDPFRTTVTAIHPDGTTTRTGPITGDPIFGVVVGADGTAAQYTRTGAGGTSDPVRTTVTVIHPDGTITTGTPITGYPTESVVVGADGTAAQSTGTGIGSVSDPYLTTVSVVHPDGTITTTAPISGEAFSGGLVVGADGTAYQTTRSGTYGSVADPVRVTVTQIHPDGSITTGIPISGEESGGVVVGADGTVYQTISTGTYGSVADPVRTTVMVIHPDGTSTPNPPITGEAISGGTVVGADGTAYQTTRTGTSATGADSYRTTVTVIHLDGTITSTEPIPGSPAGGVAIGADGTGYQTANTGNGSSADPFRTTVTVIHPDGTITTTGPITGVPFGGVVVGADGAAHQTTRTGAGSVANPYVFTVSTIAVAMAVTPL